MNSNEKIYSASSAFLNRIIGGQDNNDKTETVLPSLGLTVTESVMPNRNNIETDTLQNVNRDLNKFVNMYGGTRIKNTRSTKKYISPSRTKMSNFHNNRINKTRKQSGGVFDDMLKMHDTDINSRITSDDMPFSISPYSVPRKSKISTSQQESTSRFNNPRKYIGGDYTDLSDLDISSMSSTMDNDSDIIYGGKSRIRSQNKRHIYGGTKSYETIDTNEKNIKNTQHDRNIRRFEDYYEYDDRNDRYVHNDRDVQNNPRNERTRREQERIIQLAIHNIHRNIDTLESTVRTNNIFISNNRDATDRFIIGAIPRIETENESMNTEINTLNDILRVIHTSPIYDLRYLYATAYQITINELPTEEFDHIEYIEHIMNSITDEQYDDYRRLFNVLDDINTPYADYDFEFDERSDEEEHDEEEHEEEHDEEDHDVIRGGIFKNNKQRDGHTASTRRKNKYRKIIISLTPQPSNDDKLMTIKSALEKIKQLQQRVNNTLYSIYVKINYIKRKSDINKEEQLNKLSIVLKDLMKRHEAYGIIYDVLTGTSDIEQKYMYAQLLVIIGDYDFYRNYPDYSYLNKPMELIKIINDKNYVTFNNIVNKYISLKGITKDTAKDSAKNNTANISVDNVVPATQVDSIYFSKKEYDDIASALSTLDKLKQQAISRQNRIRSEIDALQSNSIAKPRDVTLDELNDKLNIETKYLDAYHIIRGYIAELSTDYSHKYALAVQLIDEPTTISDISNNYYTQPWIIASHVKQRNFSILKEMIDKLNDNIHNSDTDWDETVNYDNAEYSHDEDDDIEDDIEDDDVKMHGGKYQEKSKLTNYFNNILKMAIKKNRIKQQGGFYGGDDYEFNERKARKMAYKRLGKDASDEEIEKSIQIDKEIYDIHKQAIKDILTFVKSVPSYKKSSDEEQLKVAKQIKHTLYVQIKDIFDSNIERARELKKQTKDKKVLSTVDITETEKNWSEPSKLKEPTLSDKTLSDLEDTEADDTPVKPKKSKSAKKITNKKSKK